MQLARDIAQQYQQQGSLIRQQWTQAGNPAPDREALRELMLHVGFESRLEESALPAWRERLAALSNQRYNPKHEGPGGPK